MPKITNIAHKPDRQRYWIYVDGNYCASVRERTFPAMGLTVGQEITCEKIQELEAHHWKHAYGSESWQQEKIRLGKVKALLESLDSRIQVNVVGFGAGSTEFIAGHPDEAGKPDLEVICKDNQISVMLVEVSGTENMRGDTYWIRPDKLKYAKAHADEDVWIILHYASPVEKFVFIKPDARAEYRVVKKIIRGSEELYVEFSDESSETHTLEYFSKYLIARLDGHSQ